MNLFYTSILCALLHFSTPAPSNVIDELEQVLLRELYEDGSIHVRWVHVQNSSFHVLEGGDSSLPPLVLIHGYGATAAITWRHVLPKVTDHYHTYAINLPGFGRSSLSASFPANITESVVIDMFCSHFQSLWISLDLHAPYVVAHSFGGFVFTRCLSQDSNLASTFLLVAAPGFFPTNGGVDYYVASLVAAGMPHKLLKATGKFGKHAMTKLLEWSGNRFNPTLLEYWYHLQTSESMLSDSFMRLFLKHDYFYVKGTGLALTSFLKLNVSTVLLYGSDDAVAPPLQGQLLSELSGAKLYIIQGADHMPYNYNKGADFVEVFSSHPNTSLTHNQIRFFLKRHYRRFLSNQPLERLLLA